MCVRSPRRGWSGWLSRHSRERIKLVRGVEPGVLLPPLKPRRAAQLPAEIIAGAARLILPRLDGTCRRRLTQAHAGRQRIEVQQREKGEQGNHRRVIGAALRRREAGESGSADHASRCGQRAFAYEMLLGSLGIVATHIGDYYTWAGRRTSIVLK